MRYTELHLHTGYSLLDGLNSPAEYMERAKELGMTHIAETEHGTNAGHREFQREAKKAGIVPILGQEMYISATDRFDRRAVKKRDDDTQAYNHLIVLAQNEKGLNNLNGLSHVAWTEGFYSKPRMDMEILEEYQEGLIVLSGCLNGLISKAIENGQDALANSYTMEFKRIFGDRFFMEMQQHNGTKINTGLLSLARKHGIRPVLTSDCHFARAEDKWREDAMLIISANPKPAKDFDFSKAEKMEIMERLNYAYPERKMSFQNIDLYLHSVEDHMKGNIAKDFGEDFVAECMANTMVAAEMIGDYPYHSGLDLLPVPKTSEPYALLEKKCWAGLKKRGLDREQAYVDRMVEELNIIKDKDFSTYFLIEANAVAWGRGEGIRFGPGRGSGAGSLVNYVLYITNVDPIEHNLLFFRFINPERNDFPDIDTDVEDSRRSEVKAYLTRQHKHVASIATFGDFQGKQSVRSSSKVFMVPLGEVNRALKNADFPASMDFFPLWEATDRGLEFKRKYPKVVDFAKFLYGRKRTQGMHAGGLIVSKEPIEKYAPMQTAKDNSDDSGTRIPLVAYDMEDAADIGFIKYDFLGLKALSIISDTVRMVKDRHGVDLDLENMAFDDKRVYNTLSEGYTKGVFQCEAVPYTSLILKMGGVREFNDLVASNALVRPGAANSTAGAAYIARNKGEEMITYHHPVMKDFTNETYGVVIYQEQVMLTMTELAGMKMTTADKVRKIIGKKRDVSEFEQYKKEFIDGASEKVDPEVAEQLWHDFEAHAGYSFNKSHAVAYSMLSYWTAWLKEEYPIEFMTAVLSNEKDKDQLLDYLIEAKRMGLRLMLPHVNTSAMNFEIQGPRNNEYIRFGLSNIKFISGKISNNILAARPFETYQDFYEKATAPGAGMGARVVSSLNAIGGAAFDDNPRTGNERENFYEFLSIPAFDTRALPPKVVVQFRDLDEYSETEAFVSMGMVRKIKTGPGWARVEMVDETGSAGVFTSEHTQIETGQIYVFLIANNRVARYLKMEEFEDGADFSEFLEAMSFPDVPEGMYRVVSFNSRVTKAGKKMADVVLTDENKNLFPVLVFPMQFMLAYAKMREGQVVDVMLKETKEGTLFVDKVL